MATGTILVVAVAVIGSLTVLPALLSKLGDKVMRGPCRSSPAPRARRRGQDLGCGRRPRAPAPVDRRGAVAAGWCSRSRSPRFGLHTSEPGLQGLPAGLPIVKTINRIEAAFPGGAVPAYVVVQARDVTSPEVQSGIRRWSSRALATGQMHQPFSTQISRDRTVADVALPLAARAPTRHPTVHWTRCGAR